MSGAEEADRQAWYWGREQVLDGGKFFIPADFGTAKDGKKNPAHLWNTLWTLN